MNEVVADDFHDIFGYENVIVASLVDDTDGLKQIKTISGHHIL
jgi:hypothetical protein